MRHLTAAWARVAAPAIPLRLDSVGDPMGSQIVWEARTSGGDHGSLAGYLQYEHRGDKVRIKMLEVNPGYRGKGVARFLIEQLLRTYDREEVDPGQFTPEGAAAWNAVTGESVSPSTRAVIPQGRNWMYASRTAATVRHDERSPLDGYRWRAQRLSLIEGSGHHPDADLEEAKARQEAAYKKWRAANPGRRRMDSHKPENADAWLKGDFRYFHSGNSAPGTVAFVDYSVHGTSGDIHYLNVRSDQRRRGHARTLIQALYDRYPEVRWHWGKLMQPEMGALHESFSESHPEQTGGGSRWF